jgi:hypothetical protein
MDRIETKTVESLEIDEFFITKYESRAQADDGGGDRLHYSAHRVLDGDWYSIDVSKAFGEKTIQRCSSAFCNR